MLEERMPPIIYSYLQQLQTSIAMCKETQNALFVNCSKIKLSLNQWQLLFVRIKFLHLFVLIIHLTLMIGFLDFKFKCLDFGTTWLANNKLLYVTISMGNQSIYCLNQ